VVAAPSRHRGPLRADGARSPTAAPYREEFQRGAFTETIKQRGTKVKLLSQHNARSNPLGRASLLREDARAVRRVPGLQDHGRRRGAGAAADGALDSFSVGFAPIRHVKRDKVTVRTEVALREASLVTFPAYEDALVQAVRSMEGLTDEDRAELVQMLAESTDLRSTTPDGEPETSGSSASAEVASSVDAVRVAHNHLRAAWRAKTGKELSHV
jgi:HK97 family phage prohead protease